MQLAHACSILCKGRMVKYIETRVIGSFLQDGVRTDFMQIVQKNKIITDFS